MTRLPILQALQTQLQSITVTNGYNTDLGNNVEYFAVYEFDYDGPAGLTFRDIETEYQRVNTRYVNRLLVELQAIAFSTKDGKLEASCQILEDLIHAVIYEPWHPNVIAVRPRLDSKQIQAKGKQCISFQLTIEIEYREP